MNASSKGLACAMAAALSFGAPAAAAAASEPAAATVVHIDAGQVAGAVPRTAIGADDPVWNSGLANPVTAQRVRQAGITDLNFDSGGQTDLYDWRTNTLRPDPDAARDTAALGGYSYNSAPPQFSFDKFEQVAGDAGAGTTVHVNYGTGTPAEAAGWVDYANNVRHYRVHDWIIGEEVYNDQYTEPDQRVPAGGVQETAAVNAGRYAQNVIAFSKAMKAVDPTIKIGVELLALAPAWLTGDTPVSTRLQYFDTWSKDVAATPGLTDAVDFADVHWLGSYSNATWTIGPELATVADIAPAITSLREKLDGNARPGHRVRIIAGEVNSAPSAMPYSGTQSNAAYLADTELTLLANGVDRVEWFGLYSALEQGSPTADLGLLSTGNCQEACEAPTGTPLPTYYGQQLVSAVARPGGLLVGASATGTVSAHAVREPDGGLGVLLVNRGADATTAQLAVSGYRAAGDAEVLQSTGTGIEHSTARPDSTLALPAYSVTVVRLHH
jgi:alpha-N-arabinofuranosidase